MASRKAAPKDKDTANQDDDREIINFNDLLDDPSLSRAPSFLDIHIEDGEELNTRPCEILDAMLRAWRSGLGALGAYTDLKYDFMQVFADNLAEEFSVEVAEYIDQYPDKYRVAVAQIVVAALFRERLISMDDSSDADDE